MYLNKWIYVKLCFEIWKNSFLFNIRIILMTLKYVASYMKINEPERVKVISEF